MKNIKTHFFIVKLFSYLDEKKKLKLVKYNKNLQKNIEISIINYMHFKGTYIVYETKEKGKEYNNNGKFIFEGEYLNGERNGKGKEYYYGSLIFDGEYLNGKRYGKGKKYNSSNRLIFDGEYLNGKELKGTYYGLHFFSYEFDGLNGKGKKYDTFDDLKFEGEYLNGERNGYGREYYTNGNLKFEGDYIKDKIWNEWI